MLYEDDLKGRLLENNNQYTCLDRAGVKRLIFHLLNERVKSCINSWFE